jgi:hypothetical protein
LASHRNSESSSKQTHHLLPDTSRLNSNSNIINPDSNIPVYVNPNRNPNNINIINSNVNNQFSNSNSQVNRPNQREFEQNINNIVNNPYADPFRRDVEMVKN